MVNELVDVKKTAYISGPIGDITPAARALKTEIDNMNKDAVELQGTLAQLASSAKSSADSARDYYSKIADQLTASIAAAPSAVNDDTRRRVNLLERYTAIDGTETANGYETYVEGGGIVWKADNLITLRDNNGYIGWANQKFDVRDVRWRDSMCAVDFAVVSSNGDGVLKLGWTYKNEDRWKTDYTTVSYPVTNRTLQRVTFPLPPIPAFSGAGLPALAIRTEGSLQFASPATTMTDINLSINCSSYYAAQSTQTFQIWHHSRFGQVPNITARTLSMTRFLYGMINQGLCSLTTSDTIGDTVADDGTLAKTWSYPLKPGALIGRNTITLRPRTAGTFIIHITDSSVGTNYLTASASSAISYTVSEDQVNSNITLLLPYVSPSITSPRIVINATSRMSFALGASPVTAGSPIFDHTGTYTTQDNDFINQSVAIQDKRAMWMQLGTLTGFKFTPEKTPSRRVSIMQPDIVYQARNIGMTAGNIYLDNLYPLYWSGNRGRDRYFFADPQCSPHIDRFPIPARQYPPTYPIQGGNPAFGKDFNAWQISASIGKENQKTSIDEFRFNVMQVQPSKVPKQIRLLIIGDSTTAGAHANGHQYWKIAREAFMRSDISNGREPGTSKVSFLGTRLDSITPKTHISGTYNGVNWETDIAVCAQSGSSLNDWRTQDGYGFADNGKFSIKHWLSLYRTHDDDMNPLTLGNGTGSKITADNINKFICSTPNVVFINHTHNGGSIEDYEKTIEDIRSEFPDMPIMIGAGMPLLGSWWPELYATEFDIESSVVSRGPNYSWQQGTQRLQSAKNWTDVQRGLPSKNGKTYADVWYVPIPFITPTLEAIAKKGSATRQGVTVTSFDPSGLPIEHPNELAHFNWGLQLYGALSYRFRADDATTNITATNPLFPDRTGQAPIVGL